MLQICTLKDLNNDNKLRNTSANYYPFSREFIVFDFTRPENDFLAIHLWFDIAEGNRGKAEVKRKK